MACSPCSIPPWCLEGLYRFTRSAPVIGKTSVTQFSSSLPNTGYLGNVRISPYCRCQPVTVPQLLGQRQSGCVMFFSGFTLAIEIKNVSGVIVGHKLP